MINFDLKTFKEISEKVFNCDSPSGYSINIVNLLKGYLDEYKYDYIMPMELRVILKYINDECDKYEYEDSPMFDELPDAMFVDGIVKMVAE